MFLKICSKPPPVEVLKQQKAYQNIKTYQTNNLALAANLTGENEVLQDIMLLSCILNLVSKLWKGKWRTTSTWNKNEPEDTFHNGQKWFIFYGLQHNDLITEW